MSVHTNVLNLLSSSVESKDVEAKLAAIKSLIEKLNKEVFEDPKVNHRKSIDAKKYDALKSSEETQRALLKSLEEVNKRKTAYSDEITKTFEELNVSEIYTVQQNAGSGEEIKITVTLIDGRISISTKSVK
ncbi:hypothetical protein H8S90_09665 [Olivibacter sp. SDN3]|uniref:hypothetical protein n=1 Tax=Olivibacter sp. SDN3 TaxID=2764720 RepID=UPI001650E857|nr:hypothetical protein [Olivibacter sp. SDN3]QNL51814.1 hypothetical protein H8S90_09665 [Olivibacter sp. SDN3]